MGKPAYKVIEDWLRQQCTQLPLGSRLPSEREIAEQFNVSAMTARQAFGNLATRGWLRRVPGSGSYVSRPTVTMGSELSSFTEDMKRLGLEPSSKVLRFEIVSATPETAAVLSLGPREKVVFLERLRFADGDPMCHEVGIFPGRLSQVLADGDLFGSVHKILAKHGIVPYSASRRVAAGVGQPRECELLDLAPRSPVLKIDDTYSDQTGKPFQHARTVYRFDRYEVRSTISR